MASKFGQGDSRIWSLMSAVVPHFVGCVGCATADPVKGALMTNAIGRAFC